MKYFITLLLGSFFYFQSTAQIDTTKIVFSVIQKDSINISNNPYGLGCYETFRYFNKDGTIRKEILDGKNGRRTIITYKKNKKKIKTKYSDKWVMNSLPHCGMVIEIKE